MKNKIGIAVFALAFIGSLLMFIGINILCVSTTDQYVRQFGFPFTALESRLVSETDVVGSLNLYSSVRKDHIVWSGLFANISIASLVSLLIGYAVLRLQKYAQNRWHYR